MQDLKIFVHVYDASGKLVAQDDGLPADGLAPTSWWHPGDVITDTRTISLAKLPPGTYRVTTGMYDAVTGARLGGTRRIRRTPGRMTKSHLRR